MLKDFGDVKKAVVSTFKDLFTAPVEEPLDIMSNPFDLIPSLIKLEENTLLTAPITMSELKKALEAMKPDSAPGPDGFTARFFSCCWSIIKIDLLKMVRYSQVINNIGGSTNSSFLALIPK